MARVAVDASRRQARPSSRPSASRGSETPEQAKKRRAEQAAKRAKAADLAANFSSKNNHHAKGIAGSSSNKHVQKSTAALGKDSSLKPSAPFVPKDPPSNASSREKKENESYFSNDHDDGMEVDQTEDSVYESACDEPKQKSWDLADEIQQDMRNKVACCDSKILLEKKQSEWGLATLQLQAITARMQYPIEGSSVGEQLQYLEQNSKYICNELLEITQKLMD